MVRLQQSETRALLNFLSGLYATRDRDAFIAHLLSGLAAVVRAEAASFNEVDPVRQVTRTWMNPADLNSPADERLWAELCGEHPYVQHRMRSLSLDPVRLSDLAPRKRLARTALWNELLLPKGLEHEILAGFPNAGRVDGVGIYRNRRDFSDRERAIMSLLHPHLVQAYRNAEVATTMRAETRLLERGLEHLGSGLLILDRDGRIRFATVRGRQWLSAYFPGWSGRGRRLPGQVARWLTHETAALTNDDVPSPRRPLVVAGDGGHLTLRVISEHGQHMVLLEEMGVGGLPSAALTRLGLSRREAEVLRWVAQGKTNPEIGVILHLSPRTVQTYLERIFLKLGVETRAAAVSASVRAAKAM